MQEWKKIKPRKTKQVTFRVPEEILEQAEYYSKVRQKTFPGAGKLSMSDIFRVATVWYLLNVDPWTPIPGIDGEAVEWEKPKLK